MVTKIKLLPCPFCGGVPTLTKKQMWQGSHGYYGCYGFSVKCENEDCAITPFTRTFDTIYEKDENKQKKKAIAAWNSRTSDAVPVVRGRWRTWEEQFPDRTTRKKNNLGVFCSACQLYADGMTSYCPNCGAKMEVET